MVTTKLLPNFLAYSLESSIILIIFYLFYYAFLAQESTFRFNRYYLLFAPFAAAILPVLSLPAISFLETAQINTTYNVLLPAIEIYPVITKHVAFPSMMMWIVLGVYSIGLTISAYGFIRQIYSLQKLKTHNELENWEGNKVILTNGLYPTFSFLRTIYYDDQTRLPQEDKSMVLLHESIHIKEYHSVDIIISQLLCTIFWFNPLFRLFLSAIRLNHEYIVDARVLATAGISAQAYKKSLATSAIFSPYLNIGTFFNKSQILTRMKMMNQTPKSIKSIKIMALSIITSCLVFVFSCENNETGLSSTENVPMTDQEAAGASNDKTKTSDELFTVVDEQPTFQGGGNATFMEYVSKNIHFPEELLEKNIEGRVYLQFVIEKDGALSNVEVLRGLDPSADEVAKRAIQDSPKWTPGKQNGKPVRVRMVMPISFSL